MLGVLEEQSDHPGSQVAGAGHSGVLRASCGAGGGQWMSQCVLVAMVVSWSDRGGLGGSKLTLKQTVGWPSRHAACPPHGWPAPRKEFCRGHLDAL